MKYEVHGCRARKAILRELFHPFPFLQLLQAWVAAPSLVETCGVAEKAYAGAPGAGEFQKEAA